MIVSLHRGDWREAYASWPAACALIIDPPYGVKHRKTSSRPWRDDKGFEAREVDTSAPIIAGDHSTEERDDALTMIAWSVAAVFGPRRIDRVKPWGDPREILTLDKGEGVGAGDLDLPWKPCTDSIAIYGRGWQGKRTSSILRGAVIAFGPNAPNGRKHPNQKSLRVCRELVSKAPLGMPIVDPFMGSGMMGVAAILDGRDYYGAEIVPEYHAVASALVGEAYGPLFGGA